MSSSKPVKPYLVVIRKEKFKFVCLISLYLVVVREGDDGSTDSKDHGWVDLTMRIGGAVGHALLLEVIRGHGEHHRLLL